MIQPVLFKRFLQHPGQVGALCPSSRTLCRTIASGIGVENARVVVELGPGTGVITRELYGRLSNSGRLIAVELDSSLCTLLQRTLPGVDVCNSSASELTTILRHRQLSRADVVVSGLPWAIFPAPLQREIMQSVVENLAPGGCFVTFAYLQGRLLPAGIRFRRLLHEFFPEVRTSRVVWRNLPPAFIYRCYSGSPSERHQ